MKKKIILILLGIVAIGITVFLLFFMGIGKEEGYRMMQVYQIEGNATIERENVGIMEAYENLNLISGDKVEVAQDSYMRLKVDEDKYVLAEAGSSFSISVTGSNDKEKTNIQLEKGAVTVEVQNKLSDDSSFKVTTPNSVMAVRGTVFRISTDVDENGELITKITILEGSVSVQKKDESGNLSNEQVVEFGNEVVVYKDAQDVQIKIIDEIETTEIPLEVLEFLQEITTERRELVITEEKIKTLIEQSVEKSNIEEETTEQETTEAIDDGTTDNETTGNETTIGNETINQETTSNETTDGDTTIDQETIDNETAGNDTTTGQETTDSDALEQETTGNETIGQETTDKETGEEETTTCTVTFVYQGNIFATQTVEKGAKVSKPMLKPALNGTWDFDFNLPIYEDTKIEFISD